MTGRIAGWLVERVRCDGETCEACEDEMCDVMTDLERSLRGAGGRTGETRSISGDCCLSVVLDDCRCDGEWALVVFCHDASSFTGLLRDADLVSGPASPAICV